MTKLSEKVVKIRSKNAGPFWVTIDIFCGNADRYAELEKSLKTETVSALFAIPARQIKRFDIADLNVIKFSFPRPVPQGSPRDRDQHGAQYAVLLEELELA